MGAGNRIDPEQVVLSRTGAVELPFWNEWGQDVYRQTGPFDFDPVTVRASSTSGSPVLLADNAFVGFLDFLPGGRMRGDGTHVTVTAPPGGRLFVRLDQDPERSWDEYNAAVLGTDTPVPQPGEFFDAVEYCTWVEQKAAARSGKDVHAVLDDAFVNRYLDRLAQMELPSGKVTIDSGWVIQDQPGGEGDWEPDPRRFADLGATAARIRDAGHVPGLWFAVSRAKVTSSFCTQNPARFSDERDNATEGGPGKVPIRYALPDEHYLEHYRRIFRRYCDLGFRKFKLDMHYANKLMMRDQLRLVHQAIKECDNGAEVEHHIPDIFVSRYSDVIRTNDVLIQPDRDWRGLTAAHIRICARSSPDKVLNLDHIGGNDPTVSAEDFLEHWQILAAAPGHPVVSLLPDRFGYHVTDELRAGLWDYHRRRQPSTPLDHHRTVTKGAS